MALHGWRLFGVAGTIFAYVIVILFLSIINMQTSPLKRQQIGRYGELSDFHGYELIGNSRRQPIKWCSKLTFLSGTPFFPPLGSMKKIYASDVLNAKYKQFLKNYKNEEKKRYFVPQNNAADDDVGGGGVRGQGAGGDGGGAGGYGTGNDIGARSDADGDEENNFNVNGLTALASFPGSGNTWLRYLLQQSTGILTGSIYKDYGLLKSGFPAESICNESVLVVKTHEWGPKAWEQFSKAILLVRDPDKAILAEFNRQSGGHVGFASPDRYKRTKGRYWQKFVRTKLNVWENMNLAWAKNFTGSLKIVFYDDLVNDVEGTLRSILEFLNFFINEETFACAMSRKEGIYRRRKRILSFDPYSTAMRKHIDQIKFKVYTILGRNT